MNTCIDHDVVVKCKRPRWSYTQAALTSPTYQEVVMAESNSSTVVEYRPVPGFPGYLVGNDGSVWSSWKQHHDLRGRIVWFLTPSFRKLSPTLCQGYHIVCFRRDGATHRKPVHRLVAEMFIGQCPVGMEVCHDDGTRNNNYVQNLRYDTRKNNLADRERHGTAQKGEKNPSAKLSDAQADEIRRGRKLGESLKSLALQFLVRESTISRIANGVRRA